MTETQQTSRMAMEVFSEKMSYIPNLEWYSVYVRVCICAYVCVSAKAERGI